VKQMGRGLMLAVLGFFSLSAVAVTPTRGATPVEILFEGDNLRTIAGWLREHGRDGYIGGDVAEAMGIARPQGEEMVAARQRGFRNDEELRIAQVSADDGRDFILFMVQRPDDQVYFYLSTPGGGLQKALVSIPSKNLVVPLGRSEAELRFRHEVLYWKDRSFAP
jgi:hypothetical protein